MMRRGLLVLSAAVCCSAQSRESYRVPYQAWRQSAPALEQDAAAPTPAFADQVKVSGEAAQKFFAARTAYLTASQPAAPEQTSWASKPLATAENLLTMPQQTDQLLAVTAARIGSSIQAFPADDKDSAIRRVRQALERERAALKALTDSLAARKASLSELAAAGDNAEIQRASVFQTLNAANARRNQIAEHAKREAADWAAYYKNLLDGAGGSRTLTTSVAPAVLPAPGAAPAKILRPLNGQVPLTRYVGEWEFPNKGLFYGPQPQSVQMAITESNGRILGTLTAKFVAPAEAVTFNFQGPVVESKTQTLPLQTSDGAMGSVELIPGSAFNLLEVNFQAAGTAGNFILLKK